MSNGRTRLYNLISVFFLLMAVLVVVGVAVVMLRPS